MSSVFNMTTSPLRDRVAKIVADLPEATSSGDPHLTLAVRRKTFGYYLDDHHGDGIVGVALKAAAGEQEALIRSDPTRFYVPAYLGSKGWVGVRLDLDKVDWDEIRELITDAYRLQAPRRLVTQLDS
jgi:hypothetical protein